MDILAAAGGAGVALIVSGIYNLVATAVRKRVSVRSPESKAIEQIVPAVNALLESTSPMMQGLIALMEAQKGICNGNVDDALEVNRDAKDRFDRFLRNSAMVKMT